MDKNILQQAEKLAERNYTILMSVDKLSNGKEIFMAKNPELFGCMAQGASRKEAVENLNKARVDYIYDSIVNGVPLPDPAPIAVQTVDASYFIGPEQFTIEIKKSVEDRLQDAIQPKNRQPLFEASLRT